MSHCKSLVVIGEIYSDLQKEKLGKDIFQGLLNFPFSESLDFNDELSKFASASPSITKDETEGQFLHYNSPNMDTRVLFQPTLSALEVALDNWMQDSQSDGSTTNRYLLYAGSVTAQRAHWFLGDTLLTADQLVDLMKATTAAKKAQGPGIVSGDGPGDVTSHRVHISIGNEVARSSPEWKNVQGNSVTGFDISVNNATDLPNDAPGLVQFSSYLTDLVKLESLESRIPLSEVVGTIQFSRPTLYLFPEGQGDSCLIGVDGFNLLINSGYSKTPNCWSFARHLSRIDGFLQTHWTSNNLEGIRSILDRKLSQQSTNSAESQGPPLGVFLSPPGPQKAHANKPIDTTAQPDDGNLVVIPSLQANAVHKTLHSLKVHQMELCLHKPAMHPKAVTLLSKVGHGTLELYPLNPSEEDPDLKRFLEEWHFHYEQHQQNGVDKTKKSQHQVALSLANQLSLCCMILWRPHKQTEPITRLLLTGACHQSQIIQATDLLFHQNNMEFLKHVEAIPAKLHSAASDSAKGTPATKSSRPVSSKATASTGKASAPSSATPRASNSFKKPAAPSAPSQQNGVARKQPANASNGAPSKPTSAKPAATTGTPRTSKPKPTSASSNAAKKTTPPAPVKSEAKSPDDIKPVPTSPSLDIDPKSEDVSEISKSDVVTVDDKTEPEENHSQSIDTAPPDNSDLLQNDDETFSLDNPGVVSVSNEELIEQLPEGLPDPRPNVLSELSLNSDPNHYVKDEDFSSELLTPNSPSSNGALSLHLDPNRPTSATVECAIPEGGEADFHDESPQHFTADQLKEMGIYDDDDEEDSDPNNASHGSETKLSTQTFNPISDWGQPQGLPLPSDVDNVSAANECDSTTESVSAAAPVQDQAATSPTAEANVKSNEAEAKSKKESDVKKTPANQKDKKPAGPSSASNRGGKPAATSGRPASSTTTTPRPASSSTRTSSAATTASARETNRNNAPLSARKKPDVSSTDKKTVPAPGPAKSMAAKKPVSSAAPTKVAPLPGQTSASMNLIGNKNPYNRVHVCHFDLATIPANGDSRFVDVEYFKRIRARYYVLSALRPDVAILNALLIGKESWGAEGVAQPVTLIPTYDSAEMLQWMTDNKEKLSRLHLEIAPAAARCPIQLQDHETVCAAYRVEF